MKANSADGPRPEPYSAAGNPETKFGDEDNRDAANASTQRVHGFLPLLPCANTLPVCEQTLHQMGERLQALFESVETGIFIIDPETHRIVDANPVALSLVGTSLEQIVGSVCHRFVCPAELGRCPVTDLGQKLDNSERVLLTFSGQKRSIIKTVRTVDMSGHPYLLESFLDITDRKRAEQALAEQSAYLNTLVELSPFGIAVLDERGRIRRANTSLERLFLYFRQELQGTSIDALVIPEGLASESHHYRGDCLAGRSVHFVTRRCRRDGVLLDVEVYEVPLAIAGKPPEILTLYQDITDRKRIETEMEERHRLAVMTAEVGTILTGAEGIQQALRDCAEILIPHMRVACARIWTTREGDGQLELQAAAGSLATKDDEDTRFLEAFGLAHVVLTGQEKFVNGLTDRASFGSPECPSDQQLTACAAYPLKIGRQILGVAAVFDRQPLTDAACQALASLAQSIAQFIERKRAEASLRDSEDRFRTAFEDAPYGMCLTAPDGHFMHANSALCRTVGYSREELQHGAWPELTHPDDLERSRNAAIELGRGAGTPLEIEKRYIHKDGSTIWARLKILPVRRAGGEISHFITHIEDITLRRLAVEAQTFLAALVESSPDAIIGKTPDGTVVSWNRGARDLYGYTAEEMIGRPISVLAPSERISEVQRGLDAVGRHGQVIRYETVRLRKDGKAVDVALTLSPIRDTTGIVVGIMTIAQDITLRRLREEQTRLQTAALESTVNGIVITNISGEILWVNPAFTRLTGYSAEEAVGQKPCMLESGCQDEDFYQELWSTILGGNTWRGELVCRRKNGTLYDEEMTVTPVRGVDGSITHFVAVKQDITERKRAQEELLFKTALLETEAETAIDGILVVDRDGRVLQSNGRFAEIFSVPVEILDRNNDHEVLEYARSRVVDPDAFVQRVQYLYMHESEKARDEIRLKDGRCIDRYSAPLQGAGGRSYGRIWYFRDITDRMKAEHALRENEQRYRELFENASDIIFTTDLDGRFTSLNRAARQAFGYSEEEAAQKDIWHFVLPEYCELIRQDLVQMFSGTSHIASEIEGVVHDGRRIKLEVKPRLIWSDDKPVGIQAVARDVTGRDLVEMEVRQAQKLESVGRLASGIAHELNTPMQFVSDNVRFFQESFRKIQELLTDIDVLCQACEPPFSEKLRDIEQKLDTAYLMREIPEALTQTQEGIERVVTIVRAMKEFAHPDSREMVRADLNKALLNTLTVARNELKYVADVTTEFGELPMVVCSVGDLNQVFLNLLVNAAHAIADLFQEGSQKGKITIRTQEQLNEVLISITDNGAGIPENIRERIFDPFFTTKEVGRGTGQGLAIARAVIDRHKGSLTFESKVGHGTTFFIRLPVGAD